MRRVRIRVFLVGLYGVDNLGDDAIRDAIERAGEKLGAEIHRYAVRTDRPAEARAVRLRGRAWPAYLRAIAGADRVVIGGGGLLKDEGIRRWQGYGLLLELLGTAALARLLGKPVALVGIGVGPIYTKLGARLIRPIALLANDRLVRDRSSADQLSRLGVRNVEVCADPAFSLGSAMDLDREPRGDRQWPPRRMVISARPWYLTEPDRIDRWRRLVAGIANLADEAIEDGVTVEFVCLYWPEDQAVAREIVVAMRHGETVRIPASSTDWWGLAGTLRRTDVLVAMRYHAVVCAAMTGTPVYALAYEPKVVSVAVALGLPMVDINDRAQIDGIAKQVRTFRDAPAPRPERATVEAALERMSTSAWSGLRRALIG